MKDKMQKYFQTAKAYIVKHNELAIGIAIALVVVIVIAVVALTIYNSTPKIVYQPASACALFTPAEAKELLGVNAISSVNDEPVQSGDTATSRCGYTDGNPDKENMIVAAVVVRSGINDAGVENNKNEFVGNNPGENVETVKGLGDRAYYNQKLGQLNVLDGRDWMILSYGVGSAPEANTIEKAVELANKVLDSTGTSKNT